MAASGDPFPANPFRTASYDPEPGRERVRGWITVLAVITFFAVVMFYLYEASSASDASWPRLKEAMQFILPAVTSVLGTVLGFYFGSQKR
jgi:heme/copper-type cytochrome/quinol oxidase subunit 3